MADKTLPQTLSISFDGTVYGGAIDISGTLRNAITDGKIDRNAVFALGRKPEDPHRFTVSADGKDIAYMTRDASAWTVHFLSKDGKTETETETFPRTETKRPRRKGSPAPQVIDSGPDLLMAVTKTVNKIWPDLQPTPRRSNGARTSGLRQKLDTQNQVIRDLLQLRAEQTGQSIEEVAKALGVTL